MSVQKIVRQSISLPPRLARRVKALAKSQRTSTNRVLVDLIEHGLESKESEKERFLALADEFAACHNPAEQRRLKQELARLTFGE